MTTAQLIAMLITLGFDQVTKFIDRHDAGAGKPTGEAINDARQIEQGVQSDLVRMIAEAMEEKGLIVNGQITPDFKDSFSAENLARRMQF